MGFVQGSPLVSQTVCDAFQNGEDTIGIFLDLSKAFDTINHKILLSKLQHYGIQDIALKWFESYLGGRRQYVSLEKSLSNNHLDIIHGVPQGSILGPLLFNLPQ